jgi:ketosteroid isomerase-like protein
MNVRNTARTSILVLAIAIALTAGRAEAADETEAVKMAEAKFYSALNALFTGDVGPMEDVWSHADDVTYMGPTGGMQVGWSQVLAVWKAQAARKLGGKVEPADMHIFVGSDLAVSSGYEKGTNTINGSPVTVSIRATNVFRKENGAWKMIGHHTDLIPQLEQ